MHGSRIFSDLVTYADDHYTFAMYVRIRSHVSSVFKRNLHSDTLHMYVYTYVACRIYCWNFITTLDHEPWEFLINLVYLAVILT